jgi:hypothetical protein
VSIAPKIIVYYDAACTHNDNPFAHWLKLACNFRAAWWTCTFLDHTFQFRRNCWKSQVMGNGHRVSEIFCAATGEIQFSTKVWWKTAPHWVFPIENSLTPRLLVLIPRAHETHLGSCFLVKSLAKQRAAVRWRVIKLKISRFNGTAGLKMYKHIQKAGGRHTHSWLSTHGVCVRNESRKHLSVLWAHS